MRNNRLQKYLIALILAPGALCGRSQTAYCSAPPESVGITAAAVAADAETAIAADSVATIADTPAPLRQDTLHITPQMIDSMRNAREVHPFERKIEQNVFVPKGQWITGISISYTQSNQNDYQFLIFQGISGDTYSFRVSPMLMYAFKNDMAAGAKFSYTRSLTKLEKADVVLDSETEYNLENLYSLSHNYYATLLFRNYFSLGHSRRFGFFNEVQLELGGGQSKLTKGRGESISGNYERNFNLSVGVVPGLIMFLSNYSAIEVNIGVLGFNYRTTKTISDRIYVARRHHKSANFKINLFSITFGATFYI